MASSTALLVALTSALLRFAGRDADLYAMAELAYVAERGCWASHAASSTSTVPPLAAFIHTRPPARAQQLDLPGGVFVALDSGTRHSTAEVHTKRQVELSKALRRLKQILSVRCEGFWDFPRHPLYGREDAVGSCRSPLGAELCLRVMESLAL